MPTLLLPPLLKTERWTTGKKSSNTPFWTASCWTTWSASVQPGGMLRGIPGLKKAAKMGQVGTKAGQSWDKVGQDRDKLGHLAHHPTVVNFLCSVWQTGIINVFARDKATWDSFPARYRSSVFRSRATPSGNLARATSRFWKSSPSARWPPRPNSRASVSWPASTCWTSNFSLEKNVIGEALHCAVRIDTHQVPAAVRKAWLQIELAALTADNPGSRPTKVQRQEANEAVEARAKRRSRAADSSACSSSPCCGTPRERASCTSAVPAARQPNSVATCSRGRSGWSCSG